MDADAGRVRTALRLQAVAARVHHMDCAGFAEEVCDAVDVAGRLGYLGCLHAVVRLAAAREAMPDADGMTCGELGCLAGLRRQARATDTLDADSFTARILAAFQHARLGKRRLQGVVGSIFLPNRGDAPGRPDCPSLADGVPGAHGARRPRPVFLHLRAMRRTRDRIGVHALPVLRRPHGRRRTWRSGDERGDPCRLVS